MCSYENSYVRTCHNKTVGKQKVGCKVGREGGEEKTLNSSLGRKNDLTFQNRFSKAEREYSRTHLVGKYERRKGEQLLI